AAGHFVLQRMRQRMTSTAVKAVPLSVVDKEPRPASAVTFENAAMTYGVGDPPSKYIIADLTLDICEGELFVMVSPSGSGKSSRLKLIAGTQFPCEGQVLVAGDKRIQGPDRSRGMVFQSMETPLFNWLNVARNVEFGLKMSGVARRERQST